MEDLTTHRRDSALDPVSRMSEILFGIIMVMTFTSSMRAANVIQDDVREMLWGALGCNLAWGIIDAFLHLMNVAAERGREELTLLKLKAIPNSPESRELLRNTLPEVIGNFLSEPELDQIHDSLLKETKPHRARLLTRSDLWAALIILALVFSTIFPVAIPFMLMQDTWSALRVSNLIALILLFGVGFNLGRFAGRSPWRWGTGMTTVGVVLVSIAIAFGG